MLRQQLAQEKPWDEADVRADAAAAAPGVQKDETDDAGEGNGDRGVAAPTAAVTDIEEFKVATAAAVTTAARAAEEEDEAAILTPTDGAGRSGMAGRSGICGYQIKSPVFGS